ncbi:MAG TPA: asparagine synthase-related protein [Candidatus Deferrimicrobium sp.]|nr:asparagine synthase-related protein [Candidatus Deferrimicrobium sp.]
MIKTDSAEGILLSGGLDTSIISIIASKFIKLQSFTVKFENAPSPDIEYADLVAKLLGFQHHIYTFNEHELYDALPTVIKTTNSFDPMEIRNSVVIYLGLKAAKEKGIHTIFTGDGADELFGGYSYLFNFDQEQISNELKKLSQVMTFSSIPLAKVLGMEAKLPFLVPEVKEFALQLDSQYKIHTENKEIYGKWILRKAFEELLPKAVVWRVKTPIEVGSGTTILPKFFNEKISEPEFLQKKQNYRNEDHITIRDKEQLFYYEIYRSTIGIPQTVDLNGKICPQCNSNVNEKATYCRTCGAYPI